MKGLFVVCFVLVWCDVVYCTKVVFGFHMIYKVPKLMSSMYLPFIYKHVHLYVFVGYYTVQMNHTEKDLN